MKEGCSARTLFKTRGEVRTAQYESMQRESTAVSALAALCSRCLYLVLEPSITPEGTLSPSAVTPPLPSPRQPPAHFPSADVADERGSSGEPHAAWPASVTERRVSRSTRVTASVSVSPFPRPRGGVRAHRPLTDPWPRGLVNSLSTVLGFWGAGPGAQGPLSRLRGCDVPAVAACLPVPSGEREGPGAFGLPGGPRWPSVTLGEA